MAYFIKLYDKDFKVIGSDNWTNTQYSVQSFTLKRNSIEFDVFSCVCEEVKNSDKAIYCGLHDEEGTLVYFCFCGVPITQNHLTTINGEDLRKIFKQQIFLNLIIGEMGETFEWYIRLLDKTLELVNYEQSNGYPVYTYDVNNVFESGIEFDTSVLSDTYEVQDIWKLIQYWNTYFNVVMVAEVNFSQASPIKFVFYPISLLKQINLKDYDIHMSYSMSDINCVTLVKYDGASEGNYSYYRLSNNDIVSQDYITDGLTYQEGTHGVGYFNGKNIYAGQKFSDYLITPQFSKQYLLDLTDSNTDSEKESELVESMIEELCKYRFKSEVTIPITSVLAINEIYNVMFFENDTAKIDITRPLRYMGKLYNYNEAEYQQGVRSLSTFKLLPCSQVSLSVNSNGKETFNIKFGYLSDYWFLQRKE